MQYLLLALELASLQLKPTSYDSVQGTWIKFGVIVASTAPSLIQYRLFALQLSSPQI